MSGTITSCPSALKSAPTICLAKKGNNMNYTDIKPITMFSGEHRWLSNFYVVPGGVTYYGMTAPTTEHLFAAVKTIDPAQRAAILSADSPGKAKRIGRKVDLRPDWEDIKIGVMREILYSKFANNTELRQKLIDTGERALIEGNTWGDTFWGVDTRTGIGQNHLGQLLEEIRTELRIINEIGY